MGSYIDRNQDWLHRCFVHCYGITEVRACWMILIMCLDTGLPRGGIYGLVRGVEASGCEVWGVDERSSSWSCAFREEKMSRAQVSAQVSRNRIGIHNRWSPKCQKHHAANKLPVPPLHIPTPVLPSTHHCPHIHLQHLMPAHTVHLPSPPSALHSTSKYPAPHRAAHKPTQAKLLGQTPPAYVVCRERKASQYAGSLDPTYEEIQDGSLGTQGIMGT